MNTKNIFIALALSAALLASTTIQAQTLPVNTDSTGLLLPPLESLEVIKQSILRGGVQISNGFDLDGNALFRNDANVQGALKAVDLEIDGGMRFTGLVDPNTPADQWITIDAAGKVVGLTGSEVLDKLYGRDCNTDAGVTNPTFWTNPAGTAKLVTSECQSNTLVGINTQYPQASLDVKGNALVSNRFVVGNNSGNNVSINDKQIDAIGNYPLEINANSGNAVQFGKTASYKPVDVTITGSSTVLGDLVTNKTMTANDLTVVNTTTSKDLIISNNAEVNGRIGIGTTNPSLSAILGVKRKTTGETYFLVEDENDKDVFKISSNGTTYAHELKILSTDPFPDYVFNSDYKLASLKEVETYIQQNGHLSNIPSSDEVDKNGIGVGELQIKLLEKIEELTLYLLEQQKELEAQKQKHEAQQQEIEQLKKQVK